MVAGLRVFGFIYIRGLEFGCFVCLQRRILNMSDNVNIADTEIQAARATLREKFLRTLLALKGKTCTINTHEMNKVEGVFKGFDVDLRELLFDNLKTPYSDIPHSIVRAEDILFIEFPEEIETNVNN